MYIMSGNIKTVEFNDAFEYKIINEDPAPGIKALIQLGNIQKELNITFGEQDTVDILSYAGLEENIDYLNIDGVYMRTLYISGYPFVANSGWMDSLINFNHDTDISYHVHEVSALSALPKLHRKITELESTKRAMMRAGKIVGSEITDPLESAIELRDKIQRGQEKLFQMSIYVCVRADNLEELNKRFLCFHCSSNCRFQLFLATNVPRDALAGLITALRQRWESTRRTPPRNSPFPQSQAQSSHTSL